MRDGYEIPGTGSENDIIETPPPQSCEDCTRRAFSMKTGQMIPIRK